MAQSIIKAFRLEWMFFKLSAIADLRMRTNLLVQFLNDILWYGVQIILFEALYLHVDQLAGWTLVDMRLFLGVLFLVDGLQMVFFAHNFDVFQEKVIQGDMELQLLKPVSTQLLMTTQRLQCGYILNVLFAITWLAWSFYLVPGGVSWGTLALLALVVPAGLAVFYATRLLFHMPALLVYHSEHIAEIYFSLLRLSLRPDRLYGPGLRYFILMVVPVGMIASVPARLLIEPFDIWLLIGLLALSGFLLFAVHRLWCWAIKRYCSSH